MAKRHLTHATPVGPGEIVEVRALELVSGLLAITRRVLAVKRGLLTIRSRPRPCCRCIVQYRLEEIVGGDALQGSCLPLMRLGRDIAGYRIDVPPRAT
jgi:hypothetical protein